MGQSRGAPVPDREPGRWTGGKTVRQRTFDLVWDVGRALLLAAILWLIARVTGLVQGNRQVTIVALALILALIASLLWGLVMSWFGDGDAAPAGAGRSARRRHRIRKRYALLASVALASVFTYAFHLIEVIVGLWWTYAIIGAVALLILGVIGLYYLMPSRGSEQAAPPPTDGTSPPAPG